MTASPHIAPLPPEAVDRPPARQRGGRPGGPAPGAAGGDPVDRIPTRAAGLDLLGGMRGSGHRQAPSLVRRGDGQTIQLTPLLYSVLEAVDGRRSYPELATAVTRATDRLVGPDDVRFLVEEKLEPLGVLLRPDGSAPEAVRANPLLALRPRVVITNPDLTRRLTSPFAGLFRPGIVIPVLTAFALISTWVLFEKGLASPARHAFDQPGLLLAVFALTLLSGGFHEFGHAAACRYGGATPGVMGFGLYLVWPAFYTDVTDAYRLGRGGRLRVDLGGLYFNAIFAVVAFAGWSLTRWDALLLLIPAQLLQMLRQLAPFIRADGYHIIADLTGVPDLFSHMKPALLGLLPTHWRRPETRTLRWWARLLVTVWVLTVIPLLVGVFVLCVLTLPRIAATAWDGLGRQWGLLVEGWAVGDLAEVGIRLLSMLALALPVAGITYLIVRVSRRTIVRVRAATEGKPILRGIAVVASGAILAMVAASWWPSGQYEPIRGDEGGTLQQAAAPVARLMLSKPAMAAATGRAVPSLELGSLPIGTEPQPAVVLIPREEASDGDPQPVFVVIEPEGEEPQVLVVDAPPEETAAPGDSTETDDTTAGDDAGGVREGLASIGGGHTIDLSVEPEPGSPSPDRGDWPFPFPPPPEAGEDDNRAQAVNTTDGSIEYDVAFALVWVTDDDVWHRNEAWALASCTDCGTVAIAFQVVLVVGRADIVVPVNAAVSANYGCDRCYTWAIAVQLVVTLGDVPSDEIVAQIAEVWARAEELEGSAHTQAPLAVLEELRALETAILQILDEGGLIDSVTVDAEESAADDTSTTTTSSTTSSSTTSTSEPEATTTTTWEMGTVTAPSEETTTTTSADGSTTTTSEGETTTTTSEGDGSTTTTTDSTTTTDGSTTTDTTSP